MTEQADNQASPSGRRRRRRAGRKVGRNAAPGESTGQGFQQKPFKRFRYTTPAVPLISEDELESIHLASLRVLSELGIRVLHDEA